MNQRLYELLAEHLTERKKILFDEVALNRTRYVTLVMEDLYQAQNTSAIQRSAESWGIQDLYVIENAHAFSHHRRIARGAFDWLTVHRFNQATNNTEACFQNLRGTGYQIAVTALHAETVSLYDLDLSRKTAVVMGTELTGASAVAMKMADVYISIPTYGFTESLNVSAASSVIMANMIERIRREDRPWQLTAEEQLDLKIQWAKKSIYWSKYIVDMYESGELS
jgi:tRNA (guanosine-2'-O-)-methyltransferase